MKKLLKIMAVFVLVAAIMPFQAIAEVSAHLSVNEAIDSIWKMKHKDISELHKVVFPDEHISKGEASNCIDKVFLKINACVDKTTACVSSVYKAMREKFFGKTIVTQVLDTFRAAAVWEQEEIKKAIAGSYKEYIRDAGIADAIILVFLFPLSLFWLAQEQRDHIKKIEAQRAGLPILPDTMSLKTSAWKTSVYAMIGAGLGLAGLVALCELNEIND
jgi:hypothetical protein